MLGWTIISLITTGSSFLFCSFPNMMALENEKRIVDEQTTLTHMLPVDNDHGHCTIQGNCDQCIDVQEPTIPSWKILLPAAIENA